MKASSQKVNEQTKQEVGARVKKLICDICMVFKTTKDSRNLHLNNHRLVCLKRLTEGGYIWRRQHRQCKSDVVPHPSSFCPPPCIQAIWTSIIDGQNYGRAHSASQYTFRCAVGISTSISNGFASLQLSKRAFGEHVCEFDSVARNLFEKDY